MIFYGNFQSAAPSSSFCVRQATATFVGTPRNLHPLVCYDDGVEGQAELAERVASEILSYCLDVGGSLTGEHGIGADKACHMPKMFSENDLATMQLVRTAFDPGQLCNPDKLFPTPRLCGEVPGPYRPHPVEAAGLAERL